jgi:hypothetical protein
MLAAPTSAMLPTLKLGEEGDERLSRDHASVNGLACVVRNVRVSAAIHASSFFHFPSSAAAAPPL